jgi:phenylpropionate dioxygenase-like ring-hydroxylating dioxygenase large terminal subunit
MVALADRCVHRRFPLSQSNRVGDTIVCGYHGFAYDTSGTSVAVPGQTRCAGDKAVSSVPRDRRLRRAVAVIFGAIRAHGSRHTATRTASTPMVTATGRSV